MKKFLYSASVALCMLLAASCGDSDSETNSDVVLLKKVIETDEDGEQYIATFTYNGTKIATVTYNDGTHDVYTYTSNLITKIETFYGSTVIIEDSFEYNTGNQLSVHTYKDLEADYAEKTIYAYGANGMVTTQEFESTTTAQTQLRGTGAITVTNDNITQYSFTGTGESTPQVTTFTFDTKNDPLKNITGSALLNLAYNEGGINNILTTNDGAEISTTVYTYNSDNFPTTSVDTYDDEVTTTQYTYQ